MSRRRHPRRFRDASRVAALILAALAVAAAGVEASAQPRQDSVSRTQIGGAGGASRCIRAAATGAADDITLGHCTRAIEHERLVRSDLNAAYINRGVIHLRRREGELALADFDSAIAIEPNMGEAHLNRGAALVMVGRPGPAVAAITEALSLGVQQPYKAYYNRGAAREALGDVRGAYEDYNAALQIRPNWDPAEAELERFVRTGRERVARMIGADPSMPTTEEETVP